jgi:LysR family hydrogen peroxide-inducible transcriptional activator
MISTRQLKYLDAVARLGHFGRAAEHCGVTQPALSMQITQLERALAVTVFERRPHGIALTEAGREIARRAAAILLEIQELSDFAASSRGVLASPIRLGVIPTIAPYMLPDLMKALRLHHPGFTLQIRETQTAVLLKELGTGDLDVVVLALPVPQAEFETVELRIDKFVLALPADRVVKSRVRIPSRLLESDRLLLLEEGHCLRDQALDVCRLRPSGDADTLGASTLSTLVQMVRGGLGMTLLPQISIAQEAIRSGIRLVRFADPEPQRVIGLAWRRTSPRKRDFLELASLIREAIPAEDLE